MQNRQPTRTSVRVFCLSIAVLLLPMGHTSFRATAQTSPPESQLQITGTTMGKIGYRVLVVADPAQEEAEAIRDGVIESLQQVNLRMSTYLEDSDVSRFNRSQSTQWFAVDQLTVAVVQRAIEISDLTGGAFDMTVGPAVNAWKFGPDKGSFRPLSDDAVELLQKQVGYQNISTRISPPAIKKSNANLQIDLSAIAKGYAVDQVTAFLIGEGYERFLVEVGGEVRTKGQRAGGGLWVVAVEDPTKAKPDDLTPVESLRWEEQQVVQISDRSIATSGDYRNFHEHEGVRYSHTIDPRTCRPVANDLITASVIAEDCMTADALATAIMVMGGDDAIEFSRRHNIPTLVITRRGDDLQTITTGEYPLVPLKAIDSTAPSVKQGVSMIPTFIAAFVIFLLATVAMAVGAIFANKPVTGSCGGIAAAVGEDGESSCMVCSKPVSDCTLPEARNAS